MPGVDHLPINHRLRPLWRVLAFFAGAYVLTFGIVGFVKSKNDLGLAWTAMDHLPWALGLKANPAFSLLSIVVGALIVIGALVGRNIDRWINLICGTVFLLASMLMLLFLRSDLNFLAFGVSTCVVSAMLGMVTLTAGLYGRVASPLMARAEEMRRHYRPGRDVDPTVAAKDIEKEFPVEERPTLEEFTEEITESQKDAG